MYGKNHNNSPSILNVSLLHSLFIQFSIWINRLMNFISHYFLIINSNSRKMNYSLSYSNHFIKRNIMWTSTVDIYCRRHSSNPSSIFPACNNKKSFCKYFGRERISFVRWLLNNLKNANFPNEWANMFSSRLNINAHIHVCYNEIKCKILVNSVTFNVFQTYYMLL